MYRYGFQGQEMDDEVAGKGNSYTAEHWKYDSRLGRRWERDPVVMPNESPYAVFRNSPIILNDPNGDCPDCGANRYDISEGDNFWKLEEKWGLEHGMLGALNPDIDPSNLQIGQSIIVPYTGNYGGVLSGAETQEMLNELNSAFKESDGFTNFDEGTKQFMEENDISLQDMFTPGDTEVANRLGVSKNDYTTVKSALKEEGATEYAVGLIMKGLKVTGTSLSATTLYYYNEGVGWRNAAGKWTSWKMLSAKQESGKFIQGIQGYRNAASSARIKSLSFKTIGKKIYFVGQLYNGVDFAMNIANENYVGAIKNGMDIGVNYLMMSGGVPGLVVGGVYYAFDYIVGWENVIEVTHVTTQKFSRGWSVLSNPYVGGY